MDFIFQFQLSIFALVAIIMLAIKIYYREELYSYSSRLFKAVVLNAGLILIFEVLSWIFEGKPGTFNYIMNYLFNYTLFVFSTVVPSFWLSYIHYKVYGDIEKIRKYLWFQFPVFLSFILATINIFYPIIFTISRDTNVFERLPLISINFVIAYVLILLSLYITLKERKRIKTTVLITVVIFVVLPTIASILQFFNFGLIIMYPFIGLSVIVCYLFLETQEVAVDYLTGVYSRSRFDEFVDSKINKNDEFCVTMLDLDDFKNFNDEYGHNVGDSILIQFAKLVKQEFCEGSLVARYGGDEFVVVCDCLEGNELNKFRNQIREKIKESSDPIFNKVRFSFGYSFRTKENKFNYDDLLIKSDKKMYEDKAINKNYKRRKDDKEIKK